MQKANSAKELAGSENISTPARKDVGSGLNLRLLEAGQSWPFIPLLWPLLHAVSV